ncbi:hypothetical protein GC176_26480, partial [bacterium]|nr:hypothetical protein [bacterium]
MSKQVGSAPGRLSAQERHMRSKLTSTVAQALSIYYLTGLIVIGGVWFGTVYLPRQEHHRQKELSLVNAFTAWDGTWYASICEKGYSYCPTRQSNVAFFPVYPLLAKGLQWVLKVRSELTLLIVSHLALVALYVVLGLYVRASPHNTDSNLSQWTLLAFGLWPTTCFFRMAYSESVFLMTVLVAMYGMERLWRPAVVALVVGFASACRPVGIALLPVLLVYLWERAVIWSHRDRHEFALSVSARRTTGFPFGLVLLFCGRRWSSDAGGWSGARRRGAGIRGLLLGGV